MSPSTVITLRAVHILTGVFWVGVNVFFAFYLIPTVRASGPAGGEVMRRLAAERRVPLQLAIASILTLVTGIALMVHDGTISGGAWYRSRVGQTFSGGAALALAAALLAMATITPTGRKLMALGAAMGSAGGSAEQRALLAALQQRLGRWQRVVAVLLLLATVAMAVARYL